MAHANIDQRRDYVASNLKQGKSYGMIQILASQIFDCSKSAIIADIDMMTGDINLKRKTGIYFLIRNRVVVYIGQTINYPRRLRQHKTDKIFDSHRFVQCSQSKLNYYEARFIKFFNPEYNIYKPL